MVAVTTNLVSAQDASRIGIEILLAGGRTTILDAVVLVGANGLPVRTDAAGNLFATSDASTPFVTSPLDTMAVTVTPGTVLNAILFSVDTTGYSGVSVQLSGTWVATVGFEGSNDGANWNSISAAQAANAGSVASTQTNAASFYVPAYTKFIRARATTYTSGTINAAAFLRTNIPNPVGNITVSGTSLGINNFVPSSASNGAIIHRAISAASLNPTLVKATAGKIVGGLLVNTTAAIKRVVFYNRATAPTVGTDAVFLQISIQPNSFVALSDIFDAYGISFNTGIAYGIRGGQADADTTVVAAGDVEVTLLYV